MDTLCESSNESLYPRDRNFSVNFSERPLIWQEILFILHSIVHYTVFCESYFIKFSDVYKRNFFTQIFKGVL